MNDSETPPRKHGANSMAIACRHIVRNIESMSSRRIGFHWAPSDRNLFPDAWCTACDKALTAAGGEWTPNVLKRAGLRLLCPCCYEFARAAAEPGAQVETVRRR
jgi:hypothetical protein